MSDDEYGKQWVWRGRHLREPVTLREKLISDLESMLLLSRPYQKEYWETTDTFHLFVGKMRISGDKLFDLGELSFKEKILRIIFLFNLVIGTTFYFIEKYQHGIDNLAFLALAGIAAMSLYFLYESIYVVPVLCAGVTLTVAATLAVDAEFIVIPGFMLLTLALYLIAWFRRRPPD